MLSIDDFAVLSAEELEQVPGGGYIFLSGLEHQNIPPYLTYAIVTEYKMLSVMRCFMLSDLRLNG